MSRRRSRRPGRPCLLSPETTDLLVQAVRIGTPWAVVAGYVGIAPSTLRRWRAEGEAEQERIDAGETPDPRRAPHVELVAALEQAHAAAVVHAVAMIRRAADRGQWRAAAWWLERQCPDEFSLRAIERRLLAEAADERHASNGHLSEPEIHDLVDRVRRNAALVSAATPGN